MRFAFCLLPEERELLGRFSPEVERGRAWEERTRYSQKNAMLWVLHRLYTVKFCDAPLLHPDPAARREIILELLRERTPMLQYSAGWTPEEITAWHEEASRETCWAPLPPPLSERLG